MEEMAGSSLREYKQLEIPGAVLVRSRKFFSKTEGWIREDVNFSEITNYLGSKFDAKSIFTIRSPKGAIRGGHLEGRSRFTMVEEGVAFMVLVDMRPGNGQGKTETFYLGDSKLAWGESVVIPEGVVAAYVSISDECLSVWVGNRPYNKFDSLLTLDLFDSELDIHWPEGTIPQLMGEGTKILPLKRFLKKI